MKSILFSTTATPLQLAAVRRALVSAGAAGVTVLEGDRTAFIISDPSDDIHLDDYRNFPGVEGVQQASDKNQRVAHTAPSINLESGIEGLTVIAAPCGIESE